ncbi:acyl-CoA dehydrogenase family protein [Nonomuraea bangladeshensis]|uniref:acyl-CoA dehydrogenase family protein n=1 Tax=Nonomuraea bangladeshensis TaxID=404385 RepID=UPI003C2B39D4
MRFEISETDAALHDAASALLRAEAGPGLARLGWSEPVAAVWRKLAGLGVTGTLVAEQAGGIGLDENALPPLLEEVGRAVLPVPAVETLVVAAPLLAEHAPEQLPGVLSGDTLVAAQLGDSPVVPFGQHADLVLLRHGDRLHLYEDFSWEPVEAVDGARPLARLARPPSGGVELPADPEIAWRRGVLGTSALLVGLAAAMLDLTVGHVRERRQFGVPVGSFQAVKHALADAALAIAFARPAVLAAAWAQASGAADAGPQTSMAKILASTAAQRMARTALQCHGAIGYTTEYDLHLYAKRAWALAATWGDPGRHRARLAETWQLTPEG